MKVIQELSFSISKELKEGYSLVKLQNNLSDESVTIIPELGARLYELVLSNGKNTFSLLKKYSPSKLENRDELFTNAILFPYAGRIKDGKYIFQDQTFYLPLNYPEESNSCHGFVYDKKFDLKLTEAKDEFALCVCEYNYHGDIPGYPFEFNIQVSYKLHQREGLIFTTSITNNSRSTIPISVGWHPYFNFGCDIDDLQLKMDVSEMIKLDSKNIPDGEKFPINGESIGRIGKRHFDDCFKVNNNSQTSKTEVYCREKKLNLKIWQETGFNKYNYIVIYTTADRKNIAIEPMTSNVNAFNNSGDVILLGAKKRASFSCGVSLGNE